VSTGLCHELEEFERHLTEIDERASEDAARHRLGHDAQFRQRERTPPAVEQEHRRAKEVAQREQHAVRQVREHEHPQEDAQPLEGTTKPAPDRLPVALDAMSAGLDALLLLVHAQRVYHISPSSDTPKEPKRAIVRRAAILAAHR